MSILTITNIEDKTLSLARIIFIFYIILSMQQSSLLSSEFKELLDNRIAKHTVAFLTMFGLIVIMGGIDIRRAIFYAIIGYLWFVFSTKLDLRLNLVILSMLFLAFLYETDKIQEEKNILTDNILTELEKHNILLDNKQMRTYITGGILILTIIGTILYAISYRNKINESNLLTGGGSSNKQFDLLNFLIY